MAVTSEEGVVKTAGTHVLLITGFLAISELRGLSARNLMAQHKTLLVA
jgi:hypothetical protein